MSGIHIAAYEKLIKYLGFDDLEAEVCDHIQQLALPHEQVLNSWRLISVPSDQAARILSSWIFKKLAIIPNTRMNGAYVGGSQLWVDYIMTWSSTHLNMLKTSRRSGIIPG